MMNKQHLRLCLLLVMLLFTSSLAFAEPGLNDFAKFPVKGNVTMIDLGATKCISCRMMAPIMKKLEREYEGKADIVFIDVWQHNDQGERFNIMAIPTQIFFDRDGQEIYRHLGFMDEKAIVDQLSKMGVPKSIDKAQ